MSHPILPIFQNLFFVNSLEARQAATIFDTVADRRTNQVHLGDFLGAESTVELCVQSVLATARGGAEAGGTGAHLDA